MTDRFDPIRLTDAAARGQFAVERFITQFASVWVASSEAGDGYTEAELAAAETALGVRLPAALRTAYRLFGRRDDLTRTQDYLREPPRLYLDDEDRVLVFRTENQNVTWWGVPVHSLHLDDPPVVFRLDRLGGAAHGWGRWFDRLSLACIEMVLSESLMSGEVDLCDNRGLDDAAVTVLERRFSRIGLPDYPLWSIPDGPPVRWFVDTDVLLRDDGRQWLWVRARTHEALERVRRALSGDWLMDAE
ncbi:hypothetical protein [Micromonospora sp. CA-248212]|uniref:hypothetical protein n=1 Tax=Micromonospora sp. CA-248212 TaxID=3239961 RepID=UPI003D91C5ED